MDTEIRYGSVFSEYNFSVPVNRQLYEKHWTFEGLDSTSNSEITGVDSTAGCVMTGDLIYKTRYFHIITEQEVDSTTDISITLPEQILDQKLLIVTSKYGPLSYGDHYLIEDNGWTLVIRRINVTLQAGWVLELNVYENILTT
jgi:hypothetical protein